MAQWRNSQLDLPPLRVAFGSSLDGMIVVCIEEGTNHSNACLFQACSEIQEQPSLAKMEELKKLGGLPPSLCLWEGDSFLLDNSTSGHASPCSYSPGPKHVFCPYPCLITTNSSIQTRRQRLNLPGKALCLGLRTILPAPRSFNK